jgi:hypothetical protein
MSQIVKKFIGNRQVGNAQANMENAQYLKGRNAAGSGDVNIARVNSSDVPELAGSIELPTMGSTANSVTNKSYVDTAVSAINPADFKSSVRVVAQSNLTLSAPQTIDGVSVIAGDRVLAVGQTTASQNGIYVCAAGAWARATDANSSALVTSMMMVGVEEGTLGTNTFWFLSTINPITLDTTSLVFSKLIAQRNKETFTLSGTDITNQYVNLAKLTLSNSMDLVVSGTMQVEGVDYTLSTVSGVTRLTFAGDLASGGNAALVSGDILYVKYAY